MAQSRKKNRDPLVVTIDSLHEDGYGIASDGKHAVLGALPGETALVQPFTRRRKRTFTRIVTLNEASPDRTNPPCSAASVCGGCSLQHLKHDRQLEMKQAKLHDLLGECQPARWLPPLKGPVTGYRTKARLGVKYVAKKDRALVGFREKLSPYIAEIETCQVLAEPVGAMLPAISEMVSKMEARSSIPQIEVAIAENATALVFRHLAPLSDEDQAYLAQFGEAQNVRIHLQPAGPESTHLHYPAGQLSPLQYHLPDYELNFEFDPMDFTQINPVINRVMVPLALSLLEPGPDDHVLDLFCGIGNFSLPLAQAARRVTGIEGAARSVERARHNAALNGLTNCSFDVGDLFDAGVELLDPDANKVLLDPPRSGAERVCEVLATSNVERVVYVSCNPATLARDTQLLVTSGFQLDKAGIIDMFPHTTHVESIACFRK